MSFIIYESTPITYIQQTDYATLTTKDDTVIDIYDITVESEPVTTDLIRITATFLVKDYANISNPLAHSNIIQRSDNPGQTKIRFTTKKVFWSNYARFNSDGFLYFDLPNDNLEPTAGEYYYVHSQSKNMPTEAYVEIISVTDLNVKCEFQAGEPTVYTVFYDLILDDQPESTEYAAIDFVNEAIIEISTMLIEKKYVASEDQESVESGNGIKTKVDLIDRDIIELLFFLKPENLNLYRYFKRASFVQISRLAENTRYIATEDFEIAENNENEAVELHEFSLRLPYNIDRL